jgi:hypothetical protein
LTSILESAEQVWMDAVGDRCGATDSGVSSFARHAAVREVMIAAGVTPPKTVVGKTQQVS